MGSYGIPDVVRFIRNNNIGTLAKALQAEGCTELSDILAEVLFGDTLAPSLLTIVIDLMRTVAVTH